jgi:hypothetical protein
VENSAEVSSLPDSIDCRERSADEAWDKALYFGMTAANLAQTADTPENWNFVHTVWQYAIESLQDIPSDAPQYTEAQAKIEQYRQDQEIARQHHQQLATETAQARQPTSSEAESNPAVASLCQGVEPGPSADALTISNIQFYRPPATAVKFGPEYRHDDSNGQEDYMIGCLTNNSNQAILSVGMNVTTAHGFSSGGLDFPGDLIQPGESVPFRGPFGIDPDVTEMKVVELTSLDESYQPAATVEPQLSIAYSPTPEVSPGDSLDQFCAGVTPTKTDQPFEINQLQLYEPPRIPTPLMQSLCSI